MLVLRPSMIGLRGGVSFLSSLLPWFLFPSPSMSMFYFLLCKNPRCCHRVYFGVCVGGGPLEGHAVYNSVPRRKKIGVTAI